ncbi:MAG: S1C family serine protease [Hyphomicrobiales bacterium]
MKRLAPLALAVLLAGCMSTGPGDPRVINVEASAAPAGTSLTQSMSALVERTGPAYVTLIIHEAQRRSATSNSMLPNALTSGSGFVVDDEGHVVTAGHVAVREGYTVDARGANGRLYRGKVVAVSQSPDLALIRLSDFPGAPVTPAASPCMRAGDPVFSLGKPHAMGDTARLGEVDSMSFGRPVSYAEFGYPDAMVLRMSTRKGESGGPLFNAEGKLTGMLVSTLSDGNGRPLNLAHAIPSSMVAKFICDNGACPSGWRALARIDTSQCPA